MAGSTARASARYVRVTPMKARRVVDLIRGMQAAEALAVLQFAPQAASEPVGKVLASAVANAEHNKRPRPPRPRRSARRTSTRVRPSSGSVPAAGSGIPHPQAHQHITVVVSRAMLSCRPLRAAYRSRHDDGDVAGALAVR